VVPVSVVHRDTTRRWAVVAGVVAVLVATPPVLSVARDTVAGLRTTDLPAAEVVRRALASDTVAYTGLAESRGGTSLPDLPRLADVTAILGGTTRTRVWWRSPGRWRVDTLGATGEQGTYAGDSVLSVWDYEGNRLTTVVGSAGARLPRADDLLPPQAAGRVLRGLGRTDPVSFLPGGRRVAGRDGVALRVVPTDPRGTVTSVDLVVDDRTWLPLAVTVRGPGGDVALETHFVDLDLTAPGDDVLSPPAAPGADRDLQFDGDLVQRIDSRPWTFPARLAGLDRTRTLQQGTATYGTGLARFVVVPLPHRIGHEVENAAIDKGAAPLDVTGGTAVLLRSGVLTVVIARAGGRGPAYLLSGLVQDEVLRQAAQGMIDSPAEGFE
jgi:hypothetical protein